MTQIYHPNQWCDTIRKAKKTNPFEVIKMQQKDFISFDELQRQTNKKQTTDDKEPLRFSQVRCFRFEADKPNIMLVKHFLNEEFKSVNIGKRGVKDGNRVSLKNLPPKYTTFVPLNENKLKNLRELMPYIPSVYQDFYVELGVTQLESLDLAEDPETENFDLDE